MCFYNSCGGGKDVLSLSQTVYIVDMEAVMYVMCNVTWLLTQFIMQALPFVVELDLAQRLCSQPKDHNICNGSITKLPLT